MAVIKQVQTRFATGQWSTRVAVELTLDQALDGILPGLDEGRGKVMLCP